jgi:hypothetical protein
MRIQEINNKISENTGRIRQLQKEVSELLNQNSNLSTVKNDILVNSFCDWLQIGQQYHIRNYMSFPGSPTGVAKTENRSANFSNGDVIEFVKKNDKSVIIKVTTKVLSRIDRETGQKTSTITHTDWTFRITKQDLYNGLIQRDSELKNNFDSYLKRVESLNELLGQ